MDITPEFKACVKAAKLGSDAVASEPKQSSSSAPDAKPITSRGSAGGNKSEFELRAAKLVSEIRMLKQFLLRNRRSYLNSAWHADCDGLMTAGGGSALVASKRGGAGCGMTDADRDEIDAWTQRLVKDCSDAVRSFRPEAARSSGNLQTRQHREAVVHLIDEYLKAVCCVYSEQRAVRLKRMVERRNLARLGSGDGFGLRKRRSNARNGMLSDDLSVEPPPVRRSAARGEERKENRAPGPNVTSLMSDDDEDDEAKRNRVGLGLLDDENSEELSAAELQVLESENATLLNRLHSMKDDVRQIEGKVIKIAQLQEIFTKKVLEQEKDIEVIGQTAVGTTENVVEGNEQLREAMKKNAGLRVWILFFFLMMSFAVLFLDWYND